MKKQIAIIGLIALFAGNVFAEDAIKVEIGGIVDGKIPAKYAECIATEKSKSESIGESLNPEITWSGAPANTKSFAIISLDPDVPTNFDDAGKEGKTIDAKMPRQNFYHWALVDIPADKTSIPEGASGKVGFGAEGLNDYPKFMNLPKTPENIAKYTRYNGPCPPWNDSIPHHYHFVVYALDVPTLGLPAGFTAKEAADAIKNHTLAKGAAVATYTLNPELK